MRILVDSGNYFVDNDNVGDRASYEVLARRLLGLWPEAQIQFITGNRKLIEQIHPALRPLVPGTSQWLEDGPEFESHFAEVEAADLIIATGGGYFSDAFAAHALGVLDTLDAACQLGKPAVMMSAGFEPVCDKALLERARSVLPRLRLIACREGATGPAYLRSLGVQPHRVVVTGDDTVELAYAPRRPELSDAIGVNLRQSAYAGVDDTCIGVLQSVLADAARSRAAPLVGIPISLHGPSDVDSIAKLLGPDRWPACGLHVETPLGVLELVSRCRVVVTGSYHAAVFALSQGIPVVGITNSLHYRTKLGGLAQQFAGACTLVAIRDEWFREKVTDAIDGAWARAKELRPALLASAVDQIAASRTAYGLLPGLLQQRESADSYVAASRVLPRTAEVWRYRRALSAVTRERDALQLICSERDRVIGALVNTCDLRQRENEAITIEADRRDHVIREQVAALANLQSTLDERTAWAERMIREAERRGELVTELQLAVEERTAWAMRVIEEAERRDAVIAEMQVALTKSQQVGTPGTHNSLVARLLKRVALLRAVLWLLVRHRQA